MSEHTPRPVMDVQGVILAKMTREQAAKLIASLSSALVKDEPITARIEMSHHRESIAYGPAFTNVNISLDGGPLFGADLRVTDHALWEVQA